jgi:hypothetical protein
MNLAGWLRSRAPDGSIQLSLMQPHTVRTSLETTMFRTREITIVAVWLGSLTTGILCMLRYESIPGRLGVTSADWPADSLIRRSAEQLTLVMFVHPRCPCTNASLEELSRLAARSEGELDVNIVLVKPPDAPVDWDRSRLRSAAAKIAGAKVLTDEGGSEAYRFGAETSGLVLLYDRHGRLAFRGGITAGRGHQGDNPGARAVLDQVRGLDRVRGSGDGLAESPVYGCPLFDDTSSCDEKGPACTQRK